MPSTTTRVLFKPSASTLGRPTLMNKHATPWDRASLPGEGDASQYDRIVARNTGFDCAFRNGRGCICASGLVNDSLPLRNEADRFNAKSRDDFRSRQAPPCCA